MSMQTPFGRAFQIVWCGERNAIGGCFSPACAFAVCGGCQRLWSSVSASIFYKAQGPSQLPLFQGKEASRHLRVKEGSDYSWSHNRNKWKGKARRHRVKAGLEFRKDWGKNSNSVAQGNWIIKFNCAKNNSVHYIWHWKALGTNTSY